MDREKFFITDEHGHRHFAKEIEQSRVIAKWFGLIAVGFGAVFVGSMFFEGGPGTLSKSILGGSGIGGAVFALLWAHIKKPVAQFDREFVYHGHDIAHSTAAVPAPGTRAVQQPHGVRDDDDING